MLLGLLPIPVVGIITIVRVLLVLLGMAADVCCRTVAKIVCWKVLEGYGINIQRRWSDGYKVSCQLPPISSCLNGAAERRAQRGLFAT